MSNSIHVSSPTRVHANLTPLVDVTFLLIVFFVLVTQITNSQIADEIDLPQPEHSVAVEPELNEDSHVVLNLIPDPNNRQIVRSYRLGSLEFDASTGGLALLQKELISAMKDHPKTVVDLRADARTSYEQVYPVMLTAVSAGIKDVNLMVESGLRDEAGDAMTMSTADSKSGG